MKKSNTTKKGNLFFRLWPVRFVLWPIRYLVSPSISIIKSSWRAFLPTKVPAEQLKLFSDLAPKERWEVAREIQGWSDEQLVKERKISCLLAYLFLVSSCGVIVGILLSINYVSLFQLISYAAYGAGFFLLFAKRSMRVYSIDHHQIILFNDWIKLPSNWVPAYSKGLIGVINE